MQNIDSLFYAYRDDVYRLALSYTRSPQEAEDVCQSVFLKLLQQPSLAPGKEKSWLLKVTANQCRNLLRCAWWRKTVPLDDALPAVTPEFTEVYHAVMSLPPKYRVLIYLHYYQGYTTKEISELLGISQSAATTRLSRGRAMLKTTLKEQNI